MDILRIFVNPTQAFKSLNEKPRWLSPFIIVLLATIVNTLILTQGVLIPHRHEMYQKYGLSQEQIEKTEEQFDGFRIYILNTVAPFVYVVLGIISVTVFFYLFFPVIGHDISYVKTLTVVTNAALVRILAFIVKTPVMIAKGDYSVYTGLGLLAPLLGEKSFLFKLLSKFDFFTLWEVILLAVGLSTISRLDKKYACIITLSAWILVNFLLLIPIGNR